MVIVNQSEYFVIHICIFRFTNEEGSSDNSERLGKVNLNVFSQDLLFNLRGHNDLVLEALSVVLKQCFGFLVQNLKFRGGLCLL